MRRLFPLLVVGCTQAGPQPGEPNHPVVDGGMAHPDLTEVRDSFASHGPIRMDVLFVVDPAWSPEGVVEAIGPSLSFVPDVRVGVVSLAPADGMLGALIEVDGALWHDYGDPVPFLLTALETVAASARGDERAFDALLATTGFFREDSGIEVVIGTEAAADASDATVADVVDWAVALRPDARTLDLHVVHPCGTDAGTYGEAAVSLGGRVDPACEATSFVPLAERVGQVEWDYALSERPVLGSLRVTVEQSGYIVGMDAWDPDTQLGDFAWSDVRNSVEFLAYRPDAVAVVHATYDPVVDPDAR